MKTYVCKRLRLYTFLKGKGFNPIATIPDRDNQKYFVWIFENDELFGKALDEYFGERK